MEETNGVSLLVWGRKALFTDPLTKLGGKVFSYSLPTYEALREILESCCRGSALRWVIDQVRILKPIRVQSEGMHAAGPGGGPLSICTYLADVAYQIRAHCEHSRSRMEAGGGRDENEVLFPEDGATGCGGRMEVFLGDRECRGYIRPCVFGEGEGAYDNVNEMDFGLMVHSIGGADEADGDSFEVRLWQPKMFFGVVSFPRPEDCTAVKKIQKKNEEPAVFEKDFLRRAGFGGTPAAEEGGKA